MAATFEVTGRNGTVYDATPIRGSLFIVGKFIVKVEDGKVIETVCRATKRQVAFFADPNGYQPAI